MSWGPKVLVLVVIHLSITKSWLWVSSERFAEPTKIENIAIFQNGGRPPPRIVSNAQTASDVPNHGFLLRFRRIKQICDTWCLNFFYVDVDVKFAIFSHTESVKSHFLTQNIEFSTKTWNVARDLKRRSKYQKKLPLHTNKRKKHVALLFRLRSCIFGRPIFKQNIVARKCSIFDGN